MSDLLLEKHPFCRDLSREGVQALAGYARPVEFEAGCFIFRESQEADQFYLIREGRVALEVFTANGPALIQTIGSGDALGWSWLIPPYKWRFDARAVETTLAFALDGVKLRGRCEEDPRLGYELLKRISAIVVERLQTTRLQMLDIYGARN